MPLSSMFCSCIFRSYDYCCRFKLFKLVACNDDDNAGLEIIIHLFGNFLSRKFIGKWFVLKLFLMQRDKKNLKLACAKCLNRKNKQKYDLVVIKNICKGWKSRKNLRKGSFFMAPFRPTWGWWEHFCWIVLSRPSWSASWTWRTRSQPCTPQKKGHINTT